MRSTLRNQPATGQRRNGPLEVTGALLEFGAHPLWEPTVKGELDHPDVSQASDLAFSEVEKGGGITDGAGHEPDGTGYNLVAGETTAPGAQLTTPGDGAFSPRCCTARVRQAQGNRHMHDRLRTDAPGAPGEGLWGHISHQR